MKPAKASQNPFERAVALHQSGRTKEAESLYRQVIARNTEHSRALYALSVLLFETGRLEEAARYLERAVALTPDPRYLTNLGEIYRRTGDLPRAVGAFERVIAAYPELPEPRQNLAVTLLQMGAYAEARPHFERVIALRPAQPIPYVSLSATLFNLHHVAEAAASARRALELAPNLGSAHRYLGMALEELGDKSGAAASYRRAVALDPNDHQTHSVLIMSMLTDETQSARAHFEEARAWAKLHADPLRERIVPPTNDKNPERRLRIGYVSPDFRGHALQQYLVPLFQHHDQAAFELFLYSSPEREDEETEWYRSFAGDHFRAIQRVDDVAAAELVRRDGIDILVDLASHSSAGRLRIFASKPAPVQITWIGYPGTTGLDTIDYRLTCPYLDPPGSDLGVYAEESLYLPATFWCYDPLTTDVPVAPLPASANGFVTFGSLNSPRKVSTSVLSLWARVLAAVPDSHVFLYLEEDRREAALGLLAAHGVTRDRVAFGGRVSRREHLLRHHRIDIALDTFPFSGVTTTIDACYMGVPVVTLSGPTAVHRGSVCVALNLDLPELVANTPDEFVTRAAALAADLERLNRLRGELRARFTASPLGDTQRFARDLEALYRTVWRRYCAQN